MGCVVVLRPLRAVLGACECRQGGDVVEEGPWGWRQGRPACGSGAGVLPVAKPGPQRATHRGCGRLLRLRACAGHHVGEGLVPRRECELAAADRPVQRGQGRRPLRVLQRPGNPRRLQGHGDPQQRGLRGPDRRRGAPGRQGGRHDRQALRDARPRHRAAAPEEGGGLAVPGGCGGLQCGTMAAPRRNPAAGAGGRQRRRRRRRSAKGGGRLPGEAAKAPGGLANARGAAGPRRARAALRRPHRRRPRRRRRGRSRDVAAREGRGGSAQGGVPRRQAPRRLVRRGRAPLPPQFRGAPRERCAAAARAEAGVCVGPGEVGREARLGVRKRDALGHPAGAHHADGPRHLRGGGL
mmetsp:Transcript_87069/g.274964  ORF Transcript_87069/g.274964 Transcript_87069/m.274964 type:complete len:352 (+) Transcript_87069:435-1490(+)